MTGAVTTIKAAGGCITAVIGGRPGNRVVVPSLKNTPLMLGSPVRLVAPLQ